MNSIKICNKCHKEKPITEFYKDKTHKDGFRSICKYCSKQWKIKNPERIKELARICIIKIPKKLKLKGTKDI